MVASGNGKVMEEKEVEARLVGLVDLLCVNRNLLVWRRWMLTTLRDQKKRSDVLLPCLGSNDNLSQMYMIFGDTLPTCWLSLQMTLLMKAVELLFLWTKMEGRGNEKVMELNDEKEQG